MRVLHAVTAVTPDNAFGGPLRVAVNLCRELVSRGHDCSIVSLSYGFEGPPPSEVDGIPLRLFPARRVVPAAGFSGLSSLALATWAKKTIKDFDVVHVHLARDLVSLPIARMAQKSGVQTVLQTHGMVDPSQRLLAQVLDAVVTRKTLQSASAILFLTEHERRDLNLVAALQPARLHRLPNGAPRQAQTPRNQSRPQVLFLGRLHPRKRPEDFVRVAAALRTRGVDADFVIAGPDEGALGSTLALIGELGLDDRVSYAGGLTHEQGLSLMRESTVYLLPSVDEPFPMTVLEAMSLAVPVVITTSNGLAADVAQSGAGRAVPSDVALLSEAVIELLDPDANAIASKAALEISRTRFSMNLIVDQLEGIYCQVTATN